MESLKEEGLTKSIGVSNFREEDLLEMKDHWKIPPALNQVLHLTLEVLELMHLQIEYNPYVYHAANMQRLLKLCKEQHIVIQCYGPLNSLFRSTGGPVDPVVEKIAKERSITTAQVLLLWAGDHSEGVVVT